MAAVSLLGCGRAVTRKSLQLETWGLRSLSPSVSLCTKSDSSAKDVVAPQESTKLLATKTAVEFPKKLFTNSHLPPANKDETKTVASTSPDEALKLTDEDVRKFLSRKTLVAFPERVTRHSLAGKASVTTKSGGLSKKLAEEESSSSSESDSSSDSDEEDSASEVASKTRVAFPRRDPFFLENRTMKIRTLAEESLSQVRDDESIPTKKAGTEMPHVKHMESGKTPTAKSKKIKSERREPSIKQSPNGTDVQKSTTKTVSEESQHLAAITLKKPRHLAEAPIGTPQAAAAAQPKVPPGPQQEVEKELLRWEEAKKREVQESETKEGTAPKLQEECLKDMPFRVNTTTEEEIIQEAGAQAEQQGTIPETKTAAESAQEEFDNSTYKNLQHHEYNMYTFVDFDVELSKFRQPQPSSGRLSPRH